MGSNKVCSQLNFIYCTYFEQGVPWHSGNYTVQIDSKRRMWHDKNTQLNQDCLIQSCIFGNTTSNKKILILSCIVLGQFSTIIPDPFLKLKIEHIFGSTILDQKFIQFPFNVCPSLGLPKYAETKELITCFYLV